MKLHFIPPADLPTQYCVHDRVYLTWHSISGLDAEQKYVTALLNAEAFSFLGSHTIKCHRIQCQNCQEDLWEEA